MAKEVTEQQFVDSVSAFKKHERVIVILAQMSFWGPLILIAVFVRTITAENTLGILGFMIWILISGVGAIMLTIRGSDRALTRAGLSSSCCNRGVYTSAGNRGICKKCGELAIEVTGPSEQAVPPKSDRAGG